MPAMQDPNRGRIVGSIGQVGPSAVPRAHGANAKASTRGQKRVRTHQHGPSRAEPLRGERRPINKSPVEHPEEVRKIGRNLLFLGGATTLFSAFAAGLNFTSQAAQGTMHGMWYTGLAGLGVALAVIGHNLRRPHSN